MGREADIGREACAWDESSGPFDARVGVLRVGCDGVSKWYIYHRYSDSNLRGSLGRTKCFHNAMGNHIGARLC